MNKRTKTFRTLAIVFTVLSLLAMFGPMIYFCGFAFLGGTATVYKVALVSSVAVVMIMTMVSALAKWAARSRIWIILLALFFCLDSFLTVIIVFCVTQILDELVFCPLKRYFWHKHSINSEMDKRGV